jgi:hypothetical protein
MLTEAVTNAVSNNYSALPTLEGTSPTEWLPGVKGAILRHSLEEFSQEIPVLFAPPAGNKELSPTPAPPSVDDEKASLPVR